MWRVRGSSVEVGDGLSLRPRSVIKRLGRDLREAMTLQAELEREHGDEYARYVLPDGEDVSDVGTVIAELVDEARERHPDSEIRVSVFIAPQVQRGANGNGRST